jgi:hypothetical protein
MIKILISTFILLTIINTSAAVDFSHWQKFDREEKLLAVESGELESIEIDFKEIQNSPYKNQITSLYSFSLKKLSTEGIEQTVGNGGIVAIGEPEISYITLFKIKQTVVAYQLHITQRGGVDPSEEEMEEFYYNDSQSALAAGIDLDVDVSWSAHPILEIINDTVVEIELDVYNQGGFGWSGW